MGILKKIGMDWKERRFLSNLYMEQRIKVSIWPINGGDSGGGGGGWR